MSREDPHFRLRLPEKIKERLKDACEKNHRSITAEINARLEESLGFDLPGWGWPQEGESVETRLKVVLDQEREEAGFAHEEMGKDKMRRMIKELVTEILDERPAKNTKLSEPFDPKYVGAKATKKR